MARLPLRFEENQGQASREVRYLAHGGGRTLLLGDTDATLLLGPAPQRGARSAAVRWRLEGAAPSRARGERPLRTRVNYLRGSDPKRWRTNIPTCAQVRSPAVYPGIDLVYYGREGSVEYDFVVAPGADPDQIRLSLSGASATLEANGDLVLATPAGEVRQHKPVCYQEIEGLSVPVEGEFVLQNPSPEDPEHSNSGTITFRLGAYDPSHPLVIDPVLTYSTFLGGSDGEVGRGVAVDAVGAAYVTGVTVSGDFPVTPGAFDNTNSFSNDAYVAKISPDGQTLEWATFLGGGGEDVGLGIALNLKSVYITGVTNSADFPTTAGAFDTIQNGGTDAFVARLSDDGSTLEFGTYYGGTGDENINTTFFVRVGGIAVNLAGDAIISGVTNSPAIPLQNAAQGTFGGGVTDAYVASISADGTTLLYGSYLGGSSDEDLFGGGVAVGETGLIYVTGDTWSPNFPTTASALQSARQGTIDAFVTQIDPLQAGVVGILYSTYFGGNSNEVGEGIAVDDNGSAYVVGSTSSSQAEAFPLKDAFQPLFGGGGDGFLGKLDPTLVGAASLIYASYLGGGGADESANAVAVDDTHAVYIAGFTSSDTDFPLSNAIQATYGGGRGDAFVVKVQPDGAAMVYSTYLGGTGDDAVFSRGGIAVDTGHNAYVVSYTESANFPVVAPLQGSLQGGQDSFLAKLSDGGALGAPDTLVAQAISSTSIQLTWRDLSSDETGFKIERKTGAGAYSQIRVVGPNVTSFISTGLVANTAYTYQVRATRNSVNSAYSNEATATTLPLPVAPSNPAATAVSSTQIDLVWADNSGDESGFRIERKAGSGAFSVIQVVGPNVTSFSSKGLIADTPYGYRVRAFRTTDNSAYSSGAFARTLTLPVAPSVFDATTASKTQINLVWLDNSSDESGFKIERKTGAGAFAVIHIVGANVTSFSNQGLIANTTYTYRVRAYRTTDDSAFSNSDAATTLP